MARRNEERVPGGGLRGEHRDEARHALAISEKLEDLDPGLPEMPEPHADPEDDGWLYDSRRHYLEQLRHYHREEG